jgi:hypothetical protein
MVQKLKHHLGKWHIAVRVMPVIAAAIVLKIVADHYHWEIMELNALFTSLVAGTIFLISFLVKGVLTDYKESEKIPSDLAGTLKSLYDDAETIHGSKGLEPALEFRVYHRELTEMIHQWFYRKARTTALLEKISGMNRFFVEFDRGGVTPNYIIKMKSDQSHLRKTILRVDTIRDTGFVGSAYAIVEAMRLAIVLGLVMIRLEQSLYAAIFFVGLVTFLISYMLELIKDLDNPFDYVEGSRPGRTEVSLKPLEDLIRELG